MTVSEFSDVFVSYRRKDVDFVKKLVEELQAAGKECWIDWEDIPPGSVGFTDDIRRGLEGADAFLCVLSPDYLDSPYCVDMELNYAATLNKKLIPIVYRKFDDKPVPPNISHINWIYFTPHAGQENTFDESFPRVLNALDTDLEHVRQHKRFAVRALDWDAHQREGSFLLTGDEIDQGEAWLANAAGKNPLPTDLHKDYIAASRRAAKQRQRMLLSGVSVALVVSLLLAVLSFVGFQRATVAEATAVANFNEAEAQRATAVANFNAAEIARAEAQANLREAWQSQALFYGDLARQESAAAHSPGQRALLLALEALRHSDEGIVSDSAYNVVHEALRQPIAVETFVPSGGETRYFAPRPETNDVLAWSQDRAQLLGEDGSVIYDAVLPEGAHIWQPYWSPTGSYLAFTTFNLATISNGVVLVNGADGTLIASYDAPEPITSPDDLMPGMDFVTCVPDDLSTCSGGGGGDVIDVDGVSFPIGSSMPSLVPLWHPSEDRLLTYGKAGRGARLEIIDPASGEVITSQSEGDVVSIEVRWQDDEQIVKQVSHPASETFTLLDGANGETVWTQTLDSWKIYLGTTTYYAPDNRYVAYLTADPDFPLSYDVPPFARLLLLDLDRGEIRLDEPLTAGVAAVSFSPDGSHLALALNRFAEGATLYDSPEALIYQVRALPDGALVGELEDTQPSGLLQWLGSDRLVTSDAILPLDLSEPVTTLDLRPYSDWVETSPTGAKLAVVRNSDTSVQSVTVYDSASGALLLEVPSVVNGYKLFWGADDATFAVADDAGLNLVAADGTVVQAPIDERVSAFVWNAEESAWLAVAGRTIWVGSTADALVMTPLPHDAPVEEALWTDDGHILSSSLIGVTRWSLDHTPIMYSRARLDTAVPLPDGRIATTYTNYDESGIPGTVEVVLYNLERDAVEAQYALADAPFGFAWSPDGTLFMAQTLGYDDAGGSISGYRLYDTMTGEQLWAHEDANFVTHTFIWLDDNTFVQASTTYSDQGEASTTLSLIDGASGDVQTTYDPVPMQPLGLPGGTRWLIGEPAAILDVTSGERVALDADLFAEGYADVKWSDDGAYGLHYAAADATTGEVTITMFDTQTGAALSSYSGVQPLLVSWQTGADGQVFLLTKAEDGSATLNRFDGRTGETTTDAFESPALVEFVRDLYLMDDDTLFLQTAPLTFTGDAPPAVLWRYTLSTGEATPLETSQGGAFELFRWNEDRTRLFVASTTGVISEWDLTTWTRLRGVQVDYDTSSLAPMLTHILPNNVGFLTWGSGGALKEWTFDYAELVALGEAQTVRALTPDERTTLFLAPADQQP